MELCRPAGHGLRRLTSTIKSYFRLMQYSLGAGFRANRLAHLDVSSLLSMRTTILIANDEWGFVNRLISLFGVRIMQLNVTVKK